MITIERFFWGHMLVAVTALSIAYAQHSLGFCSLGIVFLGIFWLTKQQKKAWGGEGLILFVLIASAAVGVVLNLPAWLMLLAVIASLGAWDLFHFLMLLNSAERVEFASGLGREHLLRLALIELVGLLTGLAALTIHSQVTFWWEALLVLIVIISLSFLVSRIRKRTD
jgi:hypothetical protein